jgi:hypothetical protein
MGRPVCSTCEKPWLLSGSRPWLLLHATEGDKKEWHGGEEEAAVGRRGIAARRGRGGRGE